jgi:hypothetical protein
MLVAIGLAHSLMVQLEHSIGREAMYPTSIFLGFVGIVMWWTAVKSKSENYATWMGFFAAIMVWMCWVEFFYMWYGQANYGMLPRMDGMVVMGTWPEYLLMNATVGTVLMMCVFYIFDKDTRCNMFIWFQKVFKLRKGLGPTSKSSKDRNYGVITFMETFYVTWFCYAWNLIIFDPAFVGHAYSSTAIFAVGASMFVATIWGGFCLTRLVKYRRTSSALRYGIPVANILWLNWEIGTKYKFINDFWVHPAQYTEAILAMVACFTILGVLIYRAPKKLSEVSDARAHRR